MLRKEIAPGAFLTDVPGEKFKRSLMVVHLVVPGQRETASAMALLPHVLERRCAAIPDPLALSRRLFDLYGAECAADSFMAGPNRVVTVAVSCLKNQYALAGEDLEGECAELLCNLLFAPVQENGVFAAEDVSIEREKQMDFLRSEMNDKRGYCLRKARRALLGDSPLGLESAGYLEEMPSVTPESLFAVYQTLLETASVEVACCGMDAQKLGSSVAKRLASLPRHPVAPLGRMAAPKAEATSYHSEEMDTAQGKLCIMATSGQVSDVRGEAVMRVASAVLGGLPTSRLFMNVREKQSLCYYCASGYAALRGTLTLDSGVAHKDAQKAATAILYELERLQTALVSEEELAAAHLALRNSFTTAKDSPDALVSWVFNEHLRGSGQTLDEAIGLVVSVQAEEVRAALASFSPAVQYVITGKEGA